jgi:NAD/NADP transhydrogenase beta subunit
MPSNLVTTSHYIYIIARAVHSQSLGAVASGDGAARHPLRHDRHGHRAGRHGGEPRVHRLRVLFAGAFLPAAVIGLLVASRVKMTELPQLVAMLHSFVGAAAVLVGFATLLEHEAPENGPPRHLLRRNLRRRVHRVHHVHRLDRRRGQAAW